MKKFIPCTLAFLTVFLAGCYESNWADSNYVHPKFKTEYTVEEHLERLKDLTEKRFEDSLKNRRIVNYDVEILYAFYDEDPEYFLVELEYAEEWETTYKGLPKSVIKYTTNRKHLIGFIYKDNYYMGLDGYSDFQDGISAYTYLGYCEDRKYYGASNLGVFTEKGIMKVYTLYVSPSGVAPVGRLGEYESFEKSYPDAEKQKDWMQRNRRPFPSWYYRES